MREAVARDVPALRAFLQQHIETSMFLLGNLEAHGLGSDHDHATRYFLCHRGDEITGVFGVTRGGFLMCQMPRVSEREARAFVQALSGSSVRGMTGASEQVLAVLEALAIPRERWQFSDTQPLYGVRCAALPDEDAVVLRRAEEADRRLLEGWFTALGLETGLVAGEAAIADGRARADAAIGSDRFVLMIEAEKPVAMSAINARAGDAAQVGGVFVPPELRGAGRAGRIVARQLRDLQASGIDRAILFAASDKAAKAYERIGFGRLGDYRVAMLKDSVTLGGTV
ncbi:GNAT family N-acetyltransferase [Marinovum sp.]|uniref:GNAT family N-acetyltransferase n=1 Tax=Marinovum sp. TaxID=2024839 RepID=UPI003A94F6C5